MTLTSRKPNTLKIYLPLFLLFFASLHVEAQRRQAVFLKDISWTTATEYLKPDALVVIPLGAQSKEHGPHLPLATDHIQAEAIADLVSRERKLVITPIVNYGFYPAFLRYAGSTSVDFATATDMVLSIVRSLSGYGPKRFYVINIGISTTPTLAAAAKVLAEEGILLFYSDYKRPNFIATEEGIREKTLGGHADELETANVLYLRPDLVDMSKAVNDTLANGKEGILSPYVSPNTAYSPSGIEGYAALATKKKGKLYLRAFAGEVVREIDSLANSPLPPVRDRSNEYKGYAGEYRAVTNKGVIIEVQDGQLRYRLEGSGYLAPFTLYRNGQDLFSSQRLTVLFARDQQGLVEKGWFRIAGESIWMNKVR